MASAPCGVVGVRLGWMERWFLSGDLEIRMDYRPGSLDARLGSVHRVHAHSACGLWPGLACGLGLEGWWHGATRWRMADGRPRTRDHMRRYSAWSLWAATPPPPGQEQRLVLQTPPTRHLVPPPPLPSPQLESPVPAAPCRFATATLPPPHTPSSTPASRPSSYARRAVPNPTQMLAEHDCRNVPRDATWYNRPSTVSN